MDAAELDTAIDELETRLERLRALYEQYFMGIERIEPAIARKDVDRRIYVLRREKIRNTAKRFKLQTIIQRYNTFQQYWQRICREIENGTYKRHLLRAQKNGDLLTIAARKRLGRQAHASQPPEGAAPSQPPEAAAAPSQPASAKPASVPPVAPAPLRSPPPLAPPQSPVPVPVPVSGAMPRRPPPPLPARPGVPAPPAVAAVAAAPAPASPPAPVQAPAPVPRPAPRTPPPAKFESLDLDMDFMGGWDPSASRDGPKAPTAKPATPPVTRAAPSPPITRPASPPVTRAAPPPAARPAPPAVAKPAPPIAKPAPPAVDRPAPPPAAKPAPPPVAEPAPAPVAKPAPVAPPAVAKPAPAPVAKPAPVQPAAVAKPAAAPSAEDVRLRELHTRLQQAKQQTNEPKVSFEGMAKSVRAAEAKLREQHKDRKIDFDVVIKDGKAIVKPILR